MKIVYGTVFGVLVILLVAFVYLPEEDESAALTTPIPDSLLIEVRPEVDEFINLLPAQEITAYPDPNPFVQHVVSSYEDFVEQAIKRGTAPGAAVAIVRDTSIIFLRGFGLKQIGFADSIDINTVFRLGSVSKCFASVLAGTLVSNQLINWDDPIQKYYAAFQLKSNEHAEKVTIRHVLSHTTGLPYHAYTNMIEEHLPLDTLLSNLKSVKLFGEPGQIYSYQNVGYSLIEKVVEATTHQTFERALTENIFKPLNMRNSSASYQAIMSNTNVAKPHHFFRKRWVSQPISETYYNVTPAGGVNASIADMALWLRSLMGGPSKLMADSTLQEIFTPQIKAISKNRNFWRWKRPRASYYALGWRVINFQNDTLDYHGGYVNGYRCEVAIDRKNRIAICVLTNSAGNLADLSIPEFFKRYSQQADSIARWENRNNVLLVKNTDSVPPVLN